MLPTIAGEWRVGTDYELRFAPSGIAVGTMRAAASSSKKEGDEWVTTGEIWVTITVFGKPAELLAEENPSKGDRVYAAGTIQVDKWTTKENEERETTKVIARACSVVGRKGEQRGGSSQPRQQQQSSRSEPEDPWGPPAGQADEPPF